MAISLLGTASGSATSGSNVVIDLSSLGMAQNDIILVMGGHGNETGSAAASVSTSGYTSLATSASTGNYSFNASWKRMGVSPDSSVTCVGGGDAANGVAFVVMVFRGVDTTTAIDATTVTATGTAKPNSDTITTVTNGSAVVTCFLEAGTPTVTAPTDYSGQIDTSASDENPVRAGAAWRAIAIAGAENPGPWTQSVNRRWAAFTIAIRSADTAVDQDGVLSISGTADVSFVQAPEGFLRVSVTGTPAFVGASVATFGAFAMTGTGTAQFQPQGDMAFAMTGTGTVLWVGGRSRMSAVREVIERGNIRVNIS